MQLKLQFYEFRPTRGAKQQLPAVYEPGAATVTQKTVLTVLTKFLQDKAIIVFSTIAKSYIDSSKHEFLSQKNL